MSEFEIKNDLEEISHLIPRVNENTNYWFVRTEGGRYYNDFINGNFIALGYNDISLLDIKVAEDPKGPGLAALSERIKAVYPNETKPGYVASQLIRFTYLIKKGDIVIIPSHSSAVWHFGEVEQTSVYLNETPDKCEFSKRKKIRWIKYKSRNRLDAELFKLIYTQITISDITDYAPFIDRILHGIFVKGDTMHLTLEVKTKNKVSTESFYDFGEIFKLTKEICKEEGIKIDGEFNIKSKVQSEGIFEISSLFLTGVMLLGIIVVAVAGGGFSLSIKSKNTFKDNDSNDILGKINTDGIIEKVRVALNSKSERQLKAKIVEKALEDLKIEDPKDLVKILEEINTKK